MPQTIHPLSKCDRKNDYYANNYNNCEGGGGDEGCRSHDSRDSQDEAYYYRQQSDEERSDAVGPHWVYITFGVRCHAIRP